MGSQLPLGPALKLLNVAYRGRLGDAYGQWRHLSDLDRRAFHEHVPGGSGAGTYGEVAPLAVGRMLQKLGATPGSRFCDLGSLGDFSGMQF